jgi:hypothetical protein
MEVKTAIARLLIIALISFRKHFLSLRPAFLLLAFLKNYRRRILMITLRQIFDTAYDTTQ